VFTWGVGTQGQLGHGKFQVQPGMLGLGESVYVQEEPRKLVKSKKFSQLAIGELFTLGLTHDGQVFGWGHGFLGPKSQSNEPVLLPTPSSTKITYVAAGAKHAAAIDSAGQVLTWGFGGDWYKGGGQLGHGTTDSHNEPKYVEWIREYGAAIKAVSCGTSHTVFLTADGEVLTCGVGEYGRLGTGSSSNAELPASVSALIDETVVQVATGNSHSIVLDNKGKMYTWGRNDAGQLGHSDTYIDIYSMEELPRAIESPALKGKTIKQVAAGNRRSAAVTHEGDLFIWGNRLLHTPSLVERSAFDNLKVVAVACGGNQSVSCTAVVTEDGGLWTLGDAKSKILGWKGASGKQANPIRIGHTGAGGWGARRVAAVASGQGLHMAAVVEVPDE